MILVPYFLNITCNFFFLSPLFQSSSCKKAETAHHKFVQMYHQLAAEQVLFQHKLATPELLDLCSKPEMLITKLYEHPSILDPTLPDHLRPGKMFVYF